MTYLMADAHKWLFSPKGSAMLWVTRGAQSAVHPSVIGAVCGNSPLTSFDPAALEGLTEFERRFQYTGTRDYTPLIAVHDALKFRARVGEDAILAHNRGSAIWAQEWLAKAWRTETLTPPECVANMAHARVPVSSMAAATLLNRTLKEDKGVHVMGFSPPSSRTPARDKNLRTGCGRGAQLFVSRDDFRALGAAVLELAPGCEAAAKCGAAWLAKTRARSSSRRALEAAKFVSELDVGHKVTIGFAPPARSDSAFDLNARASNAVAAVAAVAVLRGRSRRRRSIPGASACGVRVRAPGARRRQRTRRRENWRRCRVDGSFADDGDGRGGKRRVQRGYVRGRIRIHRPGVVARRRHLGILTRSLREGNATFGFLDARRPDAKRCSLDCYVSGDENVRSTREHPRDAREAQMSVLVADS